MPKYSDNHTVAMEKLISTAKMHLRNYRASKSIGGVDSSSQSWVDVCESFNRASDSRSNDVDILDGWT